MEAAERPSNFAMAARKRISGFSIDSVEQLAGDRIILFRLSKRDDKASLILEMQGKGNLIITDKDMKITLAYLQEDFRERSVRVRELYLPPKNDFVKYGAMEELIGRAEGAEKETTMMSFLARNLNIGSLYLEDSLRRVGIDPRARLHLLGPSGMVKAIGAIEAEIRLAGGGGCILYLENGGPKDYALCEIEKYAALQQERCTLQEALERFYVEKEMPHESVEERELFASIEKQRALVGGIGPQIESNKAVAEIVFRNMKEINRMIAEARKNRRITKEEMNEVFRRVKTLEVDLKKKSFTIEID